MNYSTSKIQVQDKYLISTLRKIERDVNYLYSSSVKSTTVGEPTGSDLVLNVVSLTQAEYDAGTPVATTLYVITDA